MSERPAGLDQPLIGFLSNDAWEALLADVNERIERMEALPDGETRQQVFALLNGIDAMHREALFRLVRLFKQGVLEKVVSDPAIHTLMELYDLLPESAAPAPPKPAHPTIPIRAMRAVPPPPPLRYPHWVPVLAQGDDLPSGALRSDIAVDGAMLLLARRDEQWFALESSCPVDGSSLRSASWSGYTLTCPNHAGCHYDIRTGARIGGGAGLACHAVKVDAQGRVLVGLDMDFKPSLPSF
jgi:nitrite reductase/ring-hydroxylating ferredoxin subunit